MDVSRRCCIELGEYPSSRRDCRCPQEGIIRLLNSEKQLVWVCADHLKEIERRGFKSMWGANVWRPKGRPIPSEGSLGFRYRTEYFRKGPHVFRQEVRDRPAEDDEYKYHPPVKVCTWKSYQKHYSETYCLLGLKRDPGERDEFVEVDLDY